MRTIKSAVIFAAVLLLAGCTGKEVQEEYENVIDESAAIRDVLLAKMNELRVVCDEAETLTAKKYWPFPTYGDLLFGVR